MVTADYKILIDWDNDGGLTLSDFANTITEWTPFGTTPPSISASTARAYSGSHSMLIDWLTYNPFQFDTSGAGFDQGKFGSSQFSNPSNPFTFDGAGLGFDQGRFGVNAIGDPTADSPEVRRDIDNLIVGREYIVTAWAYVPSASGVAVKIGILDDGSSAFTSVTDDWTEMTFTFTATAAVHTLEIIPSTIGADGYETWVDTVTVSNSDEDMTTKTLARTDLQFVMGRDLARSVSAISAGDTAFELDNQDLSLSPDNTSSPLYNFIGPGKPILIKATFEGQQYNLFHGFLDNFQILPTYDKKSVNVSAVDLLGNLAENTISTSLYDAVQTGEAIHLILDEIGWPEDRRDIDSGATTIRWWWEEGTTGLDAVAKVVNSEGIPAFAYVDREGNFVFRDRHHRLLQIRSNTVQTTVRDDNIEPGFSVADFSYDIGWKDLINNIDLTIDDRIPSSDLSNVFQSEEIYDIAAGSTRVVSVSGSDPFLQAIVPQQNIDYILLSGVVSISLSRTSGQSIDINISAVSGAARISGLNLRAILVPVARSFKVTAEDTASIDKHGLKTYDVQMPWANVNDANSIAQIILGQRSERLPVVTYQLNNGEEERMQSLLQTELSDRVHIVEGQTFTNHDYFVERIEHTVSQAGLFHTANFGCERVRNQVTNVFTFDVAGQGFDDGLFGYSGINELSSVFILDQSNLDEKLLGY